VWDWKPKNITRNQELPSRLDFVAKYSKDFQLSTLNIRSSTNMDSLDVKISGAGAGG
jgi:hypothetical protein